MKKHILIQIVILCMIICFLLLQSFSIKPNSKEVILEIKPQFGTKTLTLEKEQYISKLGDTVSISRFRFYMSHIQLTFENGVKYSEKNSYHLVDAEDIYTLKIALKNIPEGKIKKINFDIGIDSLESVSGALDGDLDPVKGMYWAWNSGYINAKLEGTSPSSTATHKEFEFHVGGYLAPHKALRNIELDVTTQQINSVVLIANAESWFNNIHLSKTNSIVMPGTEAMQMADNYMHMFSIAN